MNISLNAFMPSLFRDPEWPTNTLYFPHSALVVKKEQQQLNSCNICYREDGSFTPWKVFTYLTRPRDWTNEISLPIMS